jgi:hypothetical protein
MELNKFPILLMKNIQEYAKKEMLRMTVVFEKLHVAENEQAKHFKEFASNYFKDGLYFFKKKMFIESFEAFIIAWAYIDCGLKLKFFQVPKEQKEWFTTG